MLSVCLAGVYTCMLYYNVTQDVSKLVGDVVSRGRVRSDKYTIQVAQLVSKLLTLQKVHMGQDEL